MRIGIDGRNLTTPLSGIGRYIWEMGNGLSKRGHEIFIYLPSRVHPTVPEIDWGAVYIGNAQSTLGRQLWAQTVLPWQAMRDRLHIFWGPAHRLPLLRLSNTKKLLTIHDLVWRKVPETMARKTYWGERLSMARSANAADVIIADSQSTKADLIAFQPSNANKVFVVRPGVDDRFFQDNPRPQILKNVKRFMLFVGTLEPRKNLSRLLFAWSQIEPEARASWTLLIAGKAGWGYEDIEGLVSKLGIESSVFIAGFVSEDDLPGLYCNADALLMPSLYEGFGLPLLEAQASGTSVLTSSISSMPEVSGPNAILVDCEDDRSIKAGLERILNRKELSQNDRLINREFAKKFTWNKSINELDVLLEKMIE